MKTIAFFNNKGGVGKTSLVYHLSYMLAELNYRVISVDLDPQSNLSSMFLDEGKLTTLWENNEGTIDNDIAPLFRGTGDIAEEVHMQKIEEVHMQEIDEKYGRLRLLAGNLALSSREDQLSESWPKCLDGDERSFRVVSAFARLVESAGREFDADVALLDVGPNLGAINRASLIASDYVVLPIAPDIFSLQGLKNVGPILVKWRTGWQERRAKKPADLDIELPTGNMRPLGYVIMRHSTHLARPVKAFRKWIDKVPEKYRKFIMKEDSDKTLTPEEDEYCMAQLKDYRSLMPLAQEANKPMFMLKPAHGAIGAQQSAVLECYNDFKALAMRIIDDCCLGVSTSK